MEHGGGPMPAFKGQLSAKQIQDVAAYVFTATHLLETAPKNDETRPGEGRDSPQSRQSAGQCQGGAGKGILLYERTGAHQPEG